MTKVHVSLFFFVQAQQIAKLEVSMTKLEKKMETRLDVMNDNLNAIRGLLTHQVVRSPAQSPVLSSRKRPSASQGSSSESQDKSHRRVLFASGSEAGPSEPAAGPSDTPRQVELTDKASGGSAGSSGSAVTCSSLFMSFFQLARGDLEEIPKIDIGYFKPNDVIQKTRVAKAKVVLVAMLSLIEGDETSFLMTMRPQSEQDILTRGDAIAKRIEEDLLKNMTSEYDAMMTEMEQNGLSATEVLGSTLNGMSRTGESAYIGTSNRLSPLYTARKKINQARNLSVPAHSGLLYLKEKRSKVVKSGPMDSFCKK